MYIHVHAMICTPACHLVLAAAQRTTEANPEPPERSGALGCRVVGVRLVPVDRVFFSSDEMRQKSSPAIAREVTISRVALYFIEAFACRAGIITRNDTAPPLYCNLLKTSLPHPHNAT